MWPALPRTDGETWIMVRLPFLGLSAIAGGGAFSWRATFDLFRLKTCHFSYPTKRTICTTFHDFRLFASKIICALTLCGPNISDLFDPVNYNYY